MEDGDIDCTFGFILKRFQVLVHLNLIKLPHYDLLLLDESGDVNACSLDLFNHIPAKKKVMVGDSSQSIYSFMHTINGFEEMEDIGDELPMTKSFRVSADIATRIQTFCQLFINKSMEFEGVPIADKSIKTMAYLSRTNSTLIERMIKLHETRTPYTLLRPVDSIFSLPLALANLSNPKWRRSPEYAHIHSAYDRYMSDPAYEKEYKSPIGYLKSYFTHDVQIQSALSILLKYTSKVIIDTYFTCKTLNKPRQVITLSTAFTAKGREYDYVYIEDDLNQATFTAIENQYDDPDSMTMFYIYYVAVSRAKVKLDNALVLDIKPKD
jgi:superfamily I DNA/RNA helicase